MSRTKQSARKATGVRKADSNKTRVPDQPISKKQKLNTSVQKAKARALKNKNKSGQASAEENEEIKPLRDTFASAEEVLLADEKIDKEHGCSDPLMEDPEELDGKIKVLEKQVKEMQYSLELMRKRKEMMTSPTGYDKQGGEVDGRDIGTDHVETHKD